MVGNVTVFSTQMLLPYIKKLNIALSENATLSLGKTNLSPIQTRELLPLSSLHLDRESMRAEKENT
jgi:hypothetical protein